MAKQTNHPSGKAWKMERASVTRQNKSRPKSNKYSGSDSDKKPATGKARYTFRVGGYTRAAGAKR